MNGAVIHWLLLCLLLAQIALSSELTRSGERLALTSTQPSLNRYLFFGTNDDEEDPSFGDGIISMNSATEDYEEYITSTIMPRLEPNICRRAVAGITAILALLTILAMLFYYITNTYYDWF